MKEILQNMKIKFPSVFIKSRYPRKLILKFVLLLVVVSQQVEAAGPTLQPLIQGGKWPDWPRGQVNDIEVAGTTAYLALGHTGLGIFDVSNVTNPVQIGT